MRRNLRKSGIDIIGDVPWGTHFCQFYQTKEDLTEILVPYFKTGLENNEFCMWVTSQPLEVEEAEKALRKAVPDVDVYLEKGQIRIISYIDWCMKDGIFDSEKVINQWIEKIEQALSGGYDGLRMTGNISWLKRKDWKDFADYEAEGDRIIGNYRIVALCTYCLDRCNASEIIDVVTNHQFALIKKEGEWEQIESSRRKEVEKALRESREDLNRAQEVGNIGSWRLKLDKNELTWSDQNYRIFGVPKRTPLSYETFLSTVHPDDREYVDKKWKEGLAGKPFDIEHRIIMDSKVRWVREKAYPEFDKEGALLGSFGITQDITERKQAEEALIRNENKFRTLAENCPDIIARFGRQKKHIYANPAAMEPYGCSPEEIVGKTNSELRMDPGNVNLWEGHYENVFTTGKPETMEFRHTSPLGKEYYFNTRIVPEFVDGEVTSVLAISRDITDIKEAEARLKEAYENLEELVEERTIQLEKAYNSLKESEKGLSEAQKMAHIGNWEWDISSNKAYWSEEMYRIFGRDPEKLAPSYNDYLCYVHPDDRDYYCNAIKKAVSGIPFDIDYRIVTDTGEERIVHMKSEFILNNRIVPVRIKGIVQDITERKKAEKAMANLEIARKKEIHHRIKNNLQVISSLLDLQAEKFNNRKCVKDSEVLKAFRESQNRVMSIALIHEELHEGKGNDTLNFSPYLKRLSKNLFQTYTLGNADTRLDIDLEEDIFFDMDVAVPLGIIINELVSNSLKHAFKGKDKGVIRIKLYREESSECANNAECTNKAECTKNMQGSKKEGEKGTNFILKVSDNGPGMPESFTTKNSGTLGIQLVHILANQLDAELELKRDSGTEFTIRFTVAEKK